VAGSRLVVGSNSNMGRGMDSIRIIIDILIACTSTASTNHKDQAHSQQVALVLVHCILKQHL
jgi:hypothetical protein